MSAARPLRLVVLISGSGSNLQAIIDSCAKESSQAKVVAVISNRDGVQGLTRAAKANIDQEVLDHSGFESREAFDRTLAERIDSYQADLVILAGFMRILSPDFVRHYSGRMLNIHPSLLPQFQGLHTHRRALEAGVSEHGASVHFVTEELDGGPVILQAAIAVKEGDTENTLAQRVLSVEHKIYPAVIDWFAQGRIKWDTDKGILFDQQPLRDPIRW